MSGCSSCACARAGDGAASGGFRINDGGGGTSSAQALREQAHSALFAQSGGGSCARCAGISSSSACSASSCAGGGARAGDGHGDAACASLTAVPPRVSAPAPSAGNGMPVGCGANCPHCSATLSRNAVDVVDSRSAVATAAPLRPMDLAVFALRLQMQENSQACASCASCRCVGGWLATQTTLISALASAELQRRAACREKAASRRAVLRGGAGPARRGRRRSAAAASGAGGVLGVGAEQAPAAAASR